MKARPASAIGLAQASHGAANRAPLPPDLAVDLDGSLLLTDTLAEGFFHALFHQPGQAVRAVLALRRGRAAAKAQLRCQSLDGLATYPVRVELLSWLNEEAATGRRLHLVTAADHQVALGAARHFRIFEDVIATTGARNLKGRTKREELDRQLDRHWSYVGDSRADMPVFLKAASIVLAGHDPALRRKVARAGMRVEADFAGSPPGLRDWLAAWRIGQWTKNLLIFIPLLLAGAFDQPAAVLGTIVAFLLTCLCASGTYILNDLADLRSDRIHPTKRHRPLASARIALPKAFLAALLLIVASLGAAFAFMPLLGGLLATYCACTLAYSTWLKRVPLLDVSILAGLYTLRLAIGAAAAGVELSGWLAAFSLTFFLSLSLAKRATEIVKYQPEGDHVPGRGYRKADELLVIAFGLAAAMVALLLMILFLVFQAFLQPSYREPHFLLAAPIFTYLWLTRIWLLAARGELMDDPVSFSIRDPLSLMLGAAMGAITMAAVVGFGG